MLSLRAIFHNSEFLATPLYIPSDPPDILHCHVNSTSDLHAFMATTHFSHHARVRISLDPGTSANLLTHGILAVHRSIIGSNMYFFMSSFGLWYCKVPFNEDTYILCTVQK